MASALSKLRKARQGSGTSLASPTITSSSAGTSSSGGGSALSRLRAARSGQSLTSKPTLTAAAQIYASDEEKKRNSQTSANKNVGGLLGGIGYTIEKAGLGFLQGVEGVVDYAVGGIAELFGNDDFSEEVIANDWLDYNHADTWYKPDDGWKFVGDVASGIGTSLPGIAAGTAVGIATGGTGLGTAAGLILSGFSAAGTSTKEAYLESGKLTGKEFGYGALMGGVEAGTEWATGLIGTGLTKAVSSVTSALGKVASKTAASVTLGGTVKQLGKEFISEAFEEGVAEILSPVAKRLTYDKNAEFASVDEVAYAALVGGLSGVVMGGFGMGSRSIRHIASGKKISDSGKVSQALDLGRMYSDVESNEATGSASIKAISEIMSRIGDVSDGKKLTVNQRRMLGELAEYTTVAPLENVMRKSAITAVRGAEPIARKLASDGNVKMVDGKLTYTTPSALENLIREGKEVRDITAEDITKGYDQSNPASILSALQKNEVLRYVAASDAAGRLMLSASQVEEAALSGSTIRNQVDLNRFIEETNKSPEKRAALGKELGIQENEWDTLQLGRFNEAIRAYRESGKADAYKHKIEIIEKAKAIPEGDAKKKMPNALTLGDGMIRRYKTEKADIAIARDGSSYMLYDYNSGDTSRSLTRAEANILLHELKAAGEVNIPTDGANTPENAENSALKNQNQGNMHVSGKKNIRYSIHDGKVVVDTDQNIFDGVDRKDYGRIARNYMREHFRGKTFSDASFTKLSEREYTSSRSTQKLFTTNNGVYDTKMKASTELDNMLRVAKKTGHEVATHPHDFNQNGYDRYDVTFSLDGKEFTGELLVAIDASDRHTFYDIVKIKRSDSPVSAGIAERGTNASNGGTDSAIGIIPNSGEKVNTSEQNSSEKSTKERIAEVRERLDAKKIDKYLTENVEEYSSFGEQNKSMIRKVVREGRANGLGDSDVLTYARAASRTGINVEFDTAMKDGEAGYFDPDKNRIVINPKTTKKHELLLIHELDHAVRAYIGNDGKIHYLAYKDADKKVSEKTRKHIKEHYADQEIDVSREELFADEASAYYSEAILDGDKFIDLLLGKEPTLQQKILSFFTGAAQSYSKDPELAKAARAHYRSFKKMFADFAERNKGRNAETAVEHSATTEKSARMSNEFDGNNIKYWQIESEKDIFANLTNVKDLQKAAYNFILKGDKGSRVTDIIEGERLEFIRISAGEYVYGEDSKRLTEEEYKQKMRMSTSIIDLIENASISYDAPDHKNHKLFPNGFKNYQGRVGIDSTIFKYIVRVGKAKNGKIFYDICLEVDGKVPRAKRTSLIKSSTSAISIPQTAKKSTDSAKKTSEISKSQRKSTNFEATLADEKPIESVAGRDAKAGGITYADLMALEREESPHALADEYIERGIPRGPISDISIGEMKKRIADSTHYKVFSKSEALEAINGMSGVQDLTSKTKDKLANTLWQGLNECTDEDSRTQFARDMAKYIVSTIVTEAKVDNPEAVKAREIITSLGTYIRNITFSSDDASRIKSLVGDKSLKSIIGRWGYKTPKEGVPTQRVPLDVFLTDISKQKISGIDALDKMDPISAFIKVNEIYEKAQTDVKDKWISAYWETTDEDILSLIEEVEIDIIDAFNTKGGQSQFAHRVKEKMGYLSSASEFWRAQYNEITQKYNKEQGRPIRLLLLSYRVQKMRELHLEIFLNHTDYNNHFFKDTFEKLRSIEFKGNINHKKAREAMQKLQNWYQSNNPMLMEMDGVPGSMLYSERIALAIRSIASREGDLSMRELGLLDEVLAHAIRIVNNFNRVWKNNKWQDASTTAKSFVEVANTTTRLRSSADIRKFTRLFESAKRWYLTSFGDPMTVFRYMDGYQDGFFTWAGEELRAGAFRHGVDVMEMKTDYDAFLKDRKGYLKKASLEAVEYGGAKMSKLQYISLYMTMQREQAQRGLGFNGFSLIDLNGRRVEVDGFISRVEARLGAELGISKDPDGTWQVSDEQMKRAVDSEISEMKKKLTADDLQFVEIIERTLNGKCKELKTARDMERLGFSNTISGYYYPIVRAMIARTIDSRSMWGELDRASNISANKNTVRGAAGALWIESVDTVFNRHIDAVARYAELSPAIDAINKVFNLDVSGNKNKPRSVRTATFNTWQIDKILGGTPSDAQKHNGEAYLKDLLADLQGISKERGVGARAVESIRSGFAISSLAANPKVLLTQLSSLFASTNILPYKSLVSGFWRGFKHGAGGDLDKYCPIAKLRNYDSSAAKAQGVVENVRGVGEWLMGGVSFMDRCVVRALWGACQNEIESTKGLKVGTEENMTEAGKLLEHILQETQQGSVATEKSAAMRSTNFLMKSITMFTSDAMKGAGRFIDANGHVASCEARLKTATGEEAEALRAELEDAKREARRSLGALAANAIYMTLIARLFSWLYAKDEEEKYPVLAFTADVFGGMIGGLPGFSDLYDFFSNGYDISDSVYDSVNDVLTAVRSIFTTATKWAEGEATGADANGTIISLVQSLCTATGIPFRNIRKTLMGLIRRFDPNSAYRLEMLTESKSYAYDFEQAMNAGDEDKAIMILEMLLSERLTREGESVSFANSAYLAEAFRLDKAGYNVKPRTIGDSVTIDGMEVELTPEEQAALRARYSEAVRDIEALIASDGYSTLTDEEKERAIRSIYDTYYDLGIYELYGYDRNAKRRVISKIIPSYKLALITATTAGIESDYEGDEAVSGSKRRKVIAAINKMPLTTAEKLLAITYKGYALKDGDIRGIRADRAKKLLISYLLRASISREEKAAVAAACGFAVKNGKISLK